MKNTKIIFYNKTKYMQCNVFYMNRQSAIVNNMYNYIFIYYKYIVLISMENIKNSIQNIQMPSTENIGEGINNTIQSIGETITNAKQSVSEGLASFSSPSNVDASTDYLNTNGIVAKFAFVLFMVLVFIILLNIGTSIVILFTKKSNNPYVVKGLISNGNSNKTIQQDPKKADSVTIYRSNNQSKGLECTWSIWIHINELTNKTNDDPSYNHIFSKGNQEFDPSSGIATVNNAPGVYLKNNDNILRIYYDEFTSNTVNVDISNIPIKKWILLNIRIQNTLLDIYLNGTIVARHNYSLSLPKQNYDNVLIGHNGGFNGKLSNLRYYPYALSVFEMNNILLQGPTFVESSEDSRGLYNYLSNMWYMSKM